METTLNSEAVAKAHKAIDRGDIDHGEWSAPPESNRDQSGCVGSDKSYPIFAGGKVSAKGVASALGYARKNAPKLVAALEGLDNAIKKKSGKSNMSRALYLSTGTDDPIIPVPLGLAGYPSHVDMKIGDHTKTVPVAYFWKDAIAAGSYVHPKTGQTLSVDLDRIDRLVDTFKGMRQAGLEIHSPATHSDHPEDNRGFVIDAKRDGDRLRVLHQVIGEDAAVTALRNRCSLCIEPEFVDEKGRNWGEAFTHCAFTPVPVVSGMGEFKPAFAASRGQGGEVPVYYLSARSGVADMKANETQVAAVKSLVGDSNAGAPVTDENAFDRLIEFSRQQKIDRDSLQQRLAAKESEVLTLSRAGKPAPPDPEILRDRMELTEGKINLSVEKGDLPPDIAGKLKEGLKRGGLPNTFMLSRADDLNDRPIDWALKLFEGSKIGQKILPATGSQTRVQMLSRQTPGGESDDAVKKQVADGAALGKKAVEEELARRGLATAAK